MSRMFLIPFIMVLLVGATSPGLATNPPTIELETPVHFLTPGGEDVLLQPWTYEVEATDTGLKLLPEGGARTEVILVDAAAGSHAQELTEELVQAGFDKTNPELFHLAVLLPDGTGWEALGTTSGVRPRSSALAFLRSKMPSQSPKTSMAVFPTISFTKPIDCGPYSNDIGKQEGNKPPALAVFQNRLHMIVNKYDRTGIPSHSRYFSPAAPLEHWVYGNGNWTRSETRAGLSKEGVALATFGNRLHMVRLGHDSNQLYHATFDGGEWTSAVSILKQKSKIRPALAEFEGLLHLLYVGEGSLDVWHSTNRGNGWTIPEMTGVKSVDGPALAISPIGFRRPLLHMVTTFSPLNNAPLNIKYLFLSAFGGNRWSTAEKVAKEFTVLPPSLASTQSGPEKWLQLMLTGKSAQELRQILYGPYQSGKETTVGWFDDQRFLNQKSESSPSVTFFEGCWHMVTVKSDRLLHTTFSTKDVHSQAR